MVLPLNTSKIAFFYLTIGMFEVRKWSASSIFSNISKKKEHNNQIIRNSTEFTVALVKTVSDRIES